MHADLEHERDKSKKKATDNVKWHKNMVLNPPHTNMYYDAEDNSGQLKNLRENLEKIQNLQQLFNQHIMSHNNQQSADNSHNQSPNIDHNVGSNSQKSHEAPEKHKQSVFIVEDNEFIQQSTKVQLDKLKVEHESALDGKQALDIVESRLLQGKVFDIILMDLIMPVLDGYETSKGIRKLEEKYGFQNDRQFICGFSAQQRGLDVETKCFDSGMDDIVQKPLKIEILQRLLANLG